MNSNTSTILIDGDCVTVTVNHANFHGLCLSPFILPFTIMIVPGTLSHPVPSRKVICPPGPSPGASVVAVVIAGAVLLVVNVDVDVDGEVFGHLETLGASSSQVVVKVAVTSTSASPCASPRLCRINVAIDINIDGYRAEAEKVCISTRLYRINLTEKDDASRLTYLQEAAATRSETRASFISAVGRGVIGVSWSMRLMFRED